MIGLGVTLSIASFQTLVYVSIPFFADVLLFGLLWLRQHYLRKGLEESNQRENGYWRLYSLKWEDPDAWKRLLQDFKTDVDLKGWIVDKPILCAGINVARPAAMAQLPNQFKIIVNRKTNPTVLAQDKDVGGPYEGTSAKVVALDEEMAQPLNQFKIMTNGKTNPIVLVQDKDIGSLYEGTSAKVVALDEEFELQLAGLTPDQVDALEDILFIGHIEPHSAE
jgi:hypothetical protein